MKAKRSGMKAKRSGMKGYRTASMGIDLGGGQQGLSSCAVDLVVNSGLSSDDDDVYCYIGERLKLEGRRRLWAFEPLVLYEGAEGLSSEAGSERPSCIHCKHLRRFAVFSHKPTYNTRLPLTGGAAAVWFPPPALVASNRARAPPLPAGCVSTGEGMSCVMPEPLSPVAHGYADTHTHTTHTHTLSLSLSLSLSHTHTP